MIPQVISKSSCRAPLAFCQQDSLMIRVVKWCVKSALCSSNIGCWISGNLGVILEQRIERIPSHELPAVEAIVTRIASWC